MIRGERFIPVTVQRLHSLSLWVYAQGCRRKVFFQAVEREMDFSVFWVGGFFWCPSLLVLHRIDELLMASKARDSVPVNIRHMKRLKLRNSDGLWRHGGSSVLGLPYSPVDICKCCKRKKQHGENVGCD